MVPKQESQCIVGENSFWEKLKEKRNCKFYMGNWPVASGKNKNSKVNVQIQVLIWVYYTNV